MAPDISSTASPGPPLPPTNRLGLRATAKVSAFLALFAVFIIWPSYFHHKNLMAALGSDYLPDAASFADLPDVASFAAKTHVITAARDKKRRPLNILILYPDDWRHDSIGDEHPERVRTPFLSRLAREGVRFTHNCVTTSICWISRATLFTGQYASRHGATRLYCPTFQKKENWEATWPYLLQRAGYWVGHVGKWQFWEEPGSLFNHTKFFEGKHWHGERHAADMARDEAVVFLRKRPKKKPFALTVAFYPPKPVGSSYEPGEQWSPDAAHKKMYKNFTYEEPYNVTEAQKKLPDFLRRKGAGVGRYSERFGSELQYQESLRNYHALITHVDEACEAIVDELKKEDIYDDTMIIFTTDNGMMLSRHGLAGKWHPFEESIRVPLIVRDPRMAAATVGKLDESFTLNIDLAATVLGAAGLDPHPVMQGRDIADLYLSEGSHIGPAWRNEFFYEFPNEDMVSATALVQRDWKYTFWPMHGLEQLFNLAEDPYELEDLVVIKEGATKYDGPHNERLAEMRARHDELKEEAKGGTEAPQCIKPKK
eukprot:CAMPEP_0194305562 /NCGR_PEP_ID=MMETSP0171-20130528/2966_1 /TAXON_ID=218684 /ORGANISM="Corethron pennatum, Strain L29A3" /LENGTH=539 /DNA_ID=CAMNT_0039057127 /DNA_START=88 /DNA_END=1707 /DNA_ORIENTATION=-